MKCLQSAVNAEKTRCCWVRWSGRSTRWIGLRWFTVTYPELETVLVVPVIQSSALFGDRCGRTFRPIA